MKRIIHLSHTDIMSDSRILKEMKAAELDGYDVEGIGIRLSEGAKESDYFDRSKVLSTSLVVKKWTFLPRPLRHLLTFIEFLFKSVFYVVNKKPDIVHCNDTLVLPIGYLIKVFTRAKLVYDAHELESNRNGLTPFLSKLILWIEKLLWNSVDALIVVSPSIDEWYQKNIGSKRSTIVLNSPVFNESIQHGDSLYGNEYLRTTFSIPVGRKIFLYIGILGKGRGLELILEAFKSSAVSSHVVFLGYGEMFDDLKQESHIYDNIHVHEAVPHESVVSVAKSADVGLCLVQNVSLSDYFCLPNKLFEYCFSGLPILASSFPDIASIVCKYRLGLVTDLNVESIKSSVNKFEEQGCDIGFTHQELRPLSWEAQTENLLGLYKTILVK